MNDQQVIAAIVQKVFESGRGGLPRDQIHLAFMEGLAQTAIEICHETGDENTFVDFCVSTINDFLISCEYIEPQ